MNRLQELEVELRAAIKRAEEAEVKTKTMALLADGWCAEYAIKKRLLEVSEAESAALETALDFYADESNYETQEDYAGRSYTPDVMLDGGKRAREALGEVEA